MSKIKIIDEKETQKQKKKQKEKTEQGGRTVKQKGERKMILLSI